MSTLLVLPQWPPNASLKACCFSSSPSNPYLRCLPVLVVSAHGFKCHQQGRTPAAASS